MLYDEIYEAAHYIQQKTKVQPAWGLVLGSGLGGLADAIQDAQAIDYKDIPHFPVPTVEGHKGQLIFGKLAGVPVVAMAGRFHYYEGYSLQKVTFPIRVMKALGVGSLLVSNAAGSVNPAHEIGDLVFIKDHINLLPDNPLRGPNDERLGPRFPDMLHTYDKALLEQAMVIAKEQGFRAHTGVFAVMSGPNLETPAEYTFLHRIGADLAGMSTVPEVIVAKHAGMRISAVSVVTDLGYPPEAIRETTHEAVLEAANEAAHKLQFIVEKLISNQ